MTEFYFMDGRTNPDRDYEVICKSVLDHISKKKNVPDELLIRTVYDYKSEWSSGLDFLLGSLSLNGSDRMGNKRYAGIINDIYKELLDLLNIDSNSCLWARRTRAYEPKPFLRPASPNKNLGFIFIDPKHYMELFPSFYAQPNSELRKACLIGGVFIFNNQTQKRRNNVNFSLTEPFFKILPQLYEEGYFSD